MDKLVLQCPIMNVTLVMVKTGYSLESRRETLLDIFLLSSMVNSFSRSSVRISFLELTLNSSSEIIQNHGIKEKSTYYHSKTDC